MIVPGLDRIRCKQILREAAGYLDLVTHHADPWIPSPEIRDRMAQRALDVLDRLGTRHGSRARVLFLRGQALLTMERYGDALAPLNAAAECDPDDVRIWLALGWCYKRTGRLDLAIQSLEEALATDPDRAIVHYNLACYWSLANNPKLSVAYLSSAFELDDDYRDHVHDEDDFDTIRCHPDFMALTTVIV